MAEVVSPIEEVGALVMTIAASGILAKRGATAPAAGASQTILYWDDPSGDVYLASGSGPALLGHDGAIDLRARAGIRAAGLKPDGTFGNAVSFYLHDDPRYMHQILGTISATPTPTANALQFNLNAGAFGTFTTVLTLYGGNAPSMTVNGGTDMKSLIVRGSSGINAEFVGDGATQARLRVANNSNAIGVSIDSATADETAYAPLIISASPVQINANLHGYADNTFDIGAAGAGRFRNIYAGTAIIVGTDPGGTDMLRVGGTVRAKALGVVDATNTLLSVSNSGGPSYVTIQVNDSGITRGRLLYAGGNGAGSRYLGLINDAADYLALLSINGAPIYSVVSGVTMLTVASTVVIVGSDPGGAQLLRIGGGAQMSGPLIVGTTDPGGSDFVRVAGGIYTNAYLKVAPGYAVGGIYTNGVQMMYMSAISGIAYTIINAPDGSNAMLLGNPGDPGNYYNNTAHYFRNRATDVTFGIWTAAALQLNTQFYPRGLNSAAMISLNTAWEYLEVAVGATVNVCAFAYGMVEISEWQSYGDCALLFLHNGGIEIVFQNATNRFGTSAAFYYQLGMVGGYLTLKNNSPNLMRFGGMTRAHK